MRGSQTMTDLVGKDYLLCDGEGVICETHKTGVRT